MTVQLIEITEAVADRLEVLTTPTSCQVGDARMIIIDLLGSGPSWPLSVLLDRVCTAYEAPAGERLMVDLRDREGLADDDLRDEPALKHVRWVRATRLALRQLTVGGEVVWSLPSDDPDEADHPEVEVLMSGAEPRAIRIYVGEPLPDGSVSLR
ncbi:hypothetical protein [Dietzia sp. ANT_WB102]|uniref:hypothetical protein n=1 Tax=Dietzia sp. ANT_WB102 TaxID=2597345 RepID=UPI0011EC7946|nr:hypothetical protein [Dietzia sp. ANT_WB102]KAA0918077.1 hypothetical protein FQ137_01390 [Dietzia sp. ANT_WB102]